MIDFGHTQEYYLSLITNHEKNKFPNGSIEEKIGGGVIVWPDMPERWAGPFVDVKSGEKCVVYSIKDSRFMHIQTEQNAISSYEQYQKYSAYNLPRKILNNLTDFVEHGYRIIYIGDDECSSSELTHEELNFCLSVMTEEQKTAWKNKINDLVQKYVDYDLKAVPTIENPISITLYGNDDTTYGISVPNKEIAEQIIKSLTNTPTWNNLYELGFVFTN